MKHEMIAKRYVQSLVGVLDSTSLDNTSELFTLLATAFSDDKFIQIMNSNDIATSAKTALILGMVANAQSSDINNLIKLLGENGRLPLIPAIAKELKRQISDIKRVYSGTIYSSSTMDQSSIDGIARDLGNKMGATISLAFAPSATNGVRIVVDGLNVEIDFSKSRLNAQITEHILKAI
ncbi:MAG: F0F1 ATP synthase subunit delta [Sulfuricurvum sp.]|uniref:F0F1 ATP synthase subunit delta n=1 Tax=Sulfuricurvum sp. TaxID=2025608 RepID=UPI002619C445|nr:F0F1 ATP synthase subunit delta [Sulfuricurvum sp.]MDD2829296.1 F0F1 ATP synthase subunit delta [Sulfuricurvum sp.]MDD4948613.1 F0F1 ATP synthase subunit delta [Sulfuricurvum sp.]